MSTERNGIKTRIVCTLGPSSNDAETISRMAIAGMDVARLNSGHADVDELVAYARTARRAGEIAGKRISVMLDLQGPRLRVGSIRGSGVELHGGQTFTLTTEQKRGDESRVSVEYQGLPGDLAEGDRIFMDDGLIRMVVRSIEDNDIVCEVVEGGVLLQGKGMNFPDSTFALSTFTARDRRYLEACLEAGIDWVAQSFVRAASDLEEVMNAVESAGGSVPVMAKIEKPEAVTNVDEILAIAQGLMVARGDLGVEMPTEDVPLIQKDLISRAQRAAVPVVTATQMLESMVEKPRPTRAEASDVANAILDGTDAVMLSAETAIGHYPVRAVEMMVRIAARTEQELDYGRLLDERRGWAHRSSADAIGFAACKIAHDLGARAIVTVTRSGYTARLVARGRPEAQVIAVGPDPSVIHATSVLWGVRGLVMELNENVDDMVGDLSSACKETGLVRAGDVIVIAGGFLGEESSKTNMVHVHTVKAG